MCRDWSPNPNLTFPKGATMAGGKRERGILKTSPMTEHPSPKHISAHASRRHAPNLSIVLERSEVLPPHKYQPTCITLHYLTHRNLIKESQSVSTEDDVCKRRPAFPVQVLHTVTFYRLSKCLLSSLHSTPVWVC